LDKIEEFIIDLLRKLNYAADEANWDPVIKRGKMQITLPMIKDGHHQVDKSRGLQFPRAVEGTTYRFGEYQNHLKSIQVD
jgi:hypothetical protein